MQIAIELTEESRELLMRHFKERTPLHEMLERATRNEVAGVVVYVFDAMGSRQRNCSRWRAIIVRRR
ncbi:MAG: hypothetical protein ACREO5_09910 [Candidatus Binatia bacterium]